MRYVVLAANSHPDYQFLLPLSCILWKTRTTYTPLVLSTTENAQMDFLDAAGLADCRVYDGADPFPNDRLAIKLSRWYSWKHVENNDELLLMDVDLWPVNGEFWNLGTDEPLAHFYADAFKDRRHIATAGLRSTAIALQDITENKTWQERLAELRKLPEDDERRHSDDAAQAELYYKKERAMFRVERGAETPPVNRIDRALWPTVFDLNHADAHLPRDASDRRVWLKIKPLFDALAPGWKDWAKAYRDAWERSSA
jgi:hypothetical protein